MRLSVAWLAVPAVVLAASCSTPPSTPTTTPVTSQRSSAPTTTAPSESTQTSTQTSTQASGQTSGQPTSGGGLPEQLVPNVVEDECVLTPAELGSLVGRSVTRAENTELADDAGRRSCFYTSSAEEPMGRTDVYAPAATSPRELVSRIAANSAGSRALPGVGEGAVVVPGRDGSFELVVASRALLIVLTLPAGAAAAPPADAGWSAAGTAMVGRLPG